MRCVFASSKPVAWYSWLDIGKISSEDFDESRKKLIYRQFNRCSRFSRWRILNEEKKRTASIVKAIEHGEIPRVWISNAAFSKCGFYHLVYQLRGKAQRIIVIEMPDGLTFRYPAYESSWAAVDCIDKEKYLKLQRELTFDERSEIENRWEVLISDNADLRVNIDGELKSVPVDFFDEEILSHAPEGQVTMGRLVGEMIAASKRYIIDGFIADRIEAMVASGKFDVVQRGYGIDDYYKNTILSKKASG